MSDEWYYKLLGTEFGPVPYEGVFTLAQAGNLQPDDEIRQGQDGSWMRADSIVGLFPESAEPEAVSDLSELDFQFVENRHAAGASNEPPLQVAAHPEIVRAHEVESEFISAGPSEMEGPVVAPATPSDDPCMAESSDPPLFDDEDELDFTASPGDRNRSHQNPSVGKSFDTARFVPHTEPAEPDHDSRPSGGMSSGAAAAAAALDAARNGESRPRASGPALGAPARPPLMPSLYESIETSPSKRSSVKNSSKSTGGGAAVIQILLLNGKLQVLVAAVVLCGAIWYVAGDFFAAMTAGTAEEHLQHLQAIYAEFQELRNRNASAGEWDSFTKRVEGEQREILSDLQRIVTPENVAGQELLSAARYDLSRMVRDARKGPNKAEESYKEHLENATQELSKQQ